MSGFEYEPNTYTLQFGESDDLHGLEVKVTSVPLGRFLGLMQLTSIAGGKVTDGSLKALDDLFSGFAEALVSWNLTRGGTNVPATAETLKSMPTEFGMRLIQEWMQVIAGISPELGKGSGSGVTYPEVPIPMAAA